MNVCVGLVRSTRFIVCLSKCYHLIFRFGRCDPV